MEQRLSLISLGVTDLGRSHDFYEALGPTASAVSSDDIAFFQAGDLVIGLWDRSKLADDSGVDDSGGWSGMTLAHNVRTRGDVDAVLAEARAAGADIRREASETFWGGYSGVFLDPDGHPWEVAHNPHWVITTDGAVNLPI